MDIQDIRAIMTTIEEQKSYPPVNQLYACLLAMFPLAEAAIDLHEFNGRISSLGMTPAQEMEKVHLFDAYVKAVEELVTK